MVGHKFAYLRLCSIPPPCPALSYKWQLKENYNKYLMLIIHSFGINLPWPCWLRHQTITFYPEGSGFKSHPGQNFFFTFSDHFQLIWLSFHDINAPRIVWKHFWISESIHYKTTHCAKCLFEPFIIQFVARFCSSWRKTMPLNPRMMNIVVANFKDETILSNITFDILIC